MKQKLFENVGGNQFKLVKEYNPEAWRGHEAPFDADPPESGDPESDPDYNVRELYDDLEEQIITFIDFLRGKNPDYDVEYVDDRMERLMASSDEYNGKMAEQLYYDIKKFVSLKGRMDTYGWKNTSGVKQRTVKELLGLLKYNRYPMGQD